MQTIKVPLSAKGFKDAAKQIRKYKKELVEKKVQEFVDELSFVGEAEIERILIGWTDTGATLGSMQRIFDESPAKSKCIVRVSSDAILFLEFGSGPMGFAGARNPEEGRMGYHPYGYTKTARTVADMEENGWWYKSDHSGRQGISFGIPAVMPMYRGGKKMEQEIYKVAKKVFG